MWCCGGGGNTHSTLQPTINVCMDAMHSESEPLGGREMERGAGRVGGRSSVSSEGV